MLNWNGSRLSEARLEMGLTPSQFARKLSEAAGYRIGHQHVMYWENGGAPGAVPFSAIIHVTGRPPEFFTGLAVSDFSLTA